MGNQKIMVEKKFVFALFACGVAGCLDGGAEPAPIDLEPPTLEAARESLQQLDELYDTEPETAMNGLRQLRSRLDELNGLVARVEITPEHHVDFYDAQASGILIAERAPAANQQFLRHEDVVERSAVELYRRLTGGGTPPAALVDAEARVNAARDLLAAGDGAAPAHESSGSGEPDLGPPPGAGLSSTTQALLNTDGPFWSNNVCYRGGDFLACLPNRTGNAWASADAKTSFSELAPYRGTILYQRSFNGAVQQIWTLFTGEWWRFYQETVGFSRVNHRWDVLDAAGDGYHWTYSFRWNCDGVACSFRP